MSRWQIGGSGDATGLGALDLLAYIGAQLAGCSAGAVLANVMFEVGAFQVSTHERVSDGHVVGEVVATAGLLAVIFALARTGRAGLSAAAVGAYIGAAYWFTSSTSFANPAVTVGRMFSDTFAGIAPASVPTFVGAQLLGAMLGLGLIVWLYPDSAASADNVVVPHESTEADKQSHH